MVVVGVVAVVGCVLPLLLPASRQCGVVSEKAHAAALCDSGM